MQYGHEHDPEPAKPTEWFAGPPAVAILGAIGCAVPPSRPNGP